MTNTHINVGGHKITTNKVGQIHTVPASDMLNGATGTIRYCVQNGICFVAFQNVIAPASKVFVKNIPQAKLGGTKALGGAGTYYIWINGDGTFTNSGTALAGHYDTFSYLVRDNYVES